MQLGTAAETRFRSSDVSKKTSRGWSYLFDSLIKEYLTDLTRLVFGFSEWWREPTTGATLLASRHSILPIVHTLRFDFSLSMTLLIQPGVSWPGTFASSEAV